MTDTITDATTESAATIEPPATTEPPAALAPPLHRLVTAIEATLPAATHPFWFPGWPGDAEAALLDAVYSPRAAYGSATTGVRRVISAWRTHRTGRDDLTAFAAVSADELTEILGNRQRVAGGAATKAAAVRDVAAALVNLGIENSNDLYECDGSDLAAAARAVTSVPGVGAASWSLFHGVQFLTRRGAELDAAVNGHVRDFVRQTLTDGDDLPDGEIDALVRDTATSMQVDAATLRHSVWRHQRRSRR